MRTVKRYDIGQLRKPEKLDNGFLKVDARLTKTGVFIYRNADGSIRRELRLAEDVFDDDSMDSFHLAPLTLGHPNVPVDADNAKKLSVGSVGKVVRDGEFQVAPLMITDADAVSAVEGGVREISNGYFMDLEEKSGVFKGQRFDFIQRNIRGNHVAIVAQGRAGPDAAIRMDSDAAVMITDDEIVFDDDRTQRRHDGDNKEKNMEKITIDGVDYEGSAQLAQAVAKLKKDSAKRVTVDVKNIESLNETIDGMKEQIKTETAKEAARADAAEEKLADVEAKLADATDPEKVQARIDSRLELERTAAKYVGDEKLGDKSEREVKELVIAKMFPKAVLDGKDDAYIEARFDAALEMDAPKSTKNDAKPAGKGVSQMRLVADEKGDSKEIVRDSKTAAAEMEQRGKDAWKLPLSASVDGHSKTVNLSDAGVR